MGAPYEYSLGHNAVAIGLIEKNLATREPHLSDLDMAQSIISQLHRHGLIVTWRQSWEKADALAKAVQALIPPQPINDI